MYVPVQIWCLYLCKLSPECLTLCVMQVSTEDAQHNFYICLWCNLLFLKSSLLVLCIFNLTMGPSQCVFMICSLIFCSSIFVWPITDMSCIWCIVQAVSPNRNFCGVNLFFFSECSFNLDYGCKKNVLGLIYLWNAQMSDIPICFSYTENLAKWISNWPETSAKVHHLTCMKWKTDGKPWPFWLVWETCTGYGNKYHIDITPKQTFFSFSNVEWIEFFGAVCERPKVLISILCATCFTFTRKKIWFVFFVC